MGCGNVRSIYQCDSVAPEVLAKRKLSISTIDIRSRHSARRVPIAVKAQFCSAANSNKHGPLARPRYALFPANFAVFHNNSKLQNLR